MNHRSPTTQSLLCVENVMVTPPEQKSSFIKRRPNRRYSGEDVFAQLSDEIILMIFQWLPKRYLVNCALVCQRWKRISYDESLWYHIDLSSRRLSPDSVAHVLLRNPRILRMAETEVITPIFQEMVSAMEDFSCHIQYLDLSGADISNTDLAELLSRCNKLRKLFLQTSITDNAVCSSIASNNNLEVLNMSCCYFLDSLGLEDILLNCTELTELSLRYTILKTECIDVVCKLLNEGIRRLDLSGCDNMKDSHVKELVSRCSCLTALDLSECTVLTEKCLDPIIAHLCDLQELSLNFCYDILPPMRHSELGMESLQNLLRKLGNMKSLQNLSFFGLHDKEKEVLKGSLPNIKIYEQKLSTIARPIVGIRYTVWGHRVCDFSQDKNEKEAQDIVLCYGVEPTHFSQYTGYFSGYSVHSTLNKFNNCSTCKEDLVEKRDGSHQQLDHQYQSTVAPDSHLVVNRAYKTESASGGLVNPSDETCQVAHKVLTVFDKHLQKTIHLVGVRKKIVLKCKQHIFQKYPRWLKAGSECEQHRNFFLDRLITSKLKRSLKDMSKDMRQPGGGSTKSKVRRKLQNLKKIFSLFVLFLLDIFIFIFSIDLDEHIFL